MNIIHLCLGNYFSEGHGYQENMLAKYHRMLGHEVTVIASVDSYNEHGRFGQFSKPGKSVLEDGTRLIRLPYRWAPFGVYVKLRRYVGLDLSLNESAPDLLFIHGCQFLDVDVVARYLAHRRGVRAVADFHSDSYNSARTFLSRHLLHAVIWRRCFWRLAPYLNKIYCTTPNVREFVKHYYGIPDNQLTDLPLAADDEAIQRSNVKEARSEIRTRLGILDDEIVVVHGGKLNREKGTFELLDAFSRYSLKATLVIFGTANEHDQKLVNTAASNFVNIKFVGWLNGDDIYNLYRAADIACFPGSQSVLWQQAIASGLPLICKYWPGGEYLDCGGNVLFFPSMDAMVIQLCVSILLNNPALIKSMAEISKSKGAEKFSYRALASKIVNDVAVAEFQE